MSTSTGTRPVGAGRLVLVLGGPAVVWAARLGLATFLVRPACRAGTIGTTAVLAVSAVAVGCSAALLVMAARLRRRVPPEPDGAGLHLVLTMGVVSAMLAIVLILFESVPVLFLDPCA